MFDLNLHPWCLQAFHQPSSFLKGIKTSTGWFGIVVGTTLNMEQRKWEELRKKNIALHVKSKRYKIISKELQNYLTKAANIKNYKGLWDCSQLSKRECNPLLVIWTIRMIEKEIVIVIASNRNGLHGREPPLNK